MGLKVRFVKPVGYKITGTIWAPDNSADCSAHSGKCIHQWELARFEGYSEDYPEFEKQMDRWKSMTDSKVGLPVVCRDCGRMFGDGYSGGKSAEALWPTPSGQLEPGCLYWNTWTSAKWYNWTNQEGPMLEVVLPNGHHWNIDSRASNCTMPEDTTHRCWVRHGDPEQGIIHVDKNGHTCQAGAGSIAVPGYHGFLHNSELTPC